jgi:hypothetical protein
MGHLGFFADAEDAPLLVGHLNADAELAFLVPVDPIAPPQLTSLPGGRLPRAREQHRWRAVHTLTGLADGWHTLWHAPSPEPLCRAPGVPIADPWAGWRGDTIVAFDDVRPELGRGLNSVAIVYLQLQTRHRPYSAEEQATGGPLNYWWTQGHEVLVDSQFSWIGGHFQSAPKVTTRWWSALRRWFGQTCAKLTDAQTGRQTFYAFPSALARLKAGIKYEANHWDLDASIRSARLP